MCRANSYTAETVPCLNTINNEDQCVNGRLMWTYTDDTRYLQSINGQDLYKEYHRECIQREVCSVDIRGYFFSKQQCERACNERRTTAKWYDKYDPDQKPLFSKLIRLPDAYAPKETPGVCERIQKNLDCRKPLSGQSGQLCVPNKQLWYYHFGYDECLSHWVGSKIWADHKSLWATRAACADRCRLQITRQLNKMINTQIKQKLLNQHALRPLLLYPALHATKVYIMNKYGFQRDRTQTEFVDNPMYDSQKNDISIGGMINKMDLLSKPGGYSVGDDGRTVYNRRPLQPILIRRTLNSNRVL
ncbi:unnamed protein product [Didymodactylos carnosus]|uniref:Uncharacterized protein n=1 Tax=Didymodactylos carnosus TaxID=1234261 RepID=A0A813P3Y3_9BILA|nr:unnamed protein product [Didymodactylos carnosus]CAF0748788.1 unnamed protein product [Didymodactylos carnosus]CAF3507464.1 unnamed protein product [Didymodactylos carnosus]CAF3528011.1 unnamed protein product [Didymodactylos carnosus]